MFSIYLKGFLVFKTNKPHKSFCYETARVIIKLYLNK